MEKTNFDKNFATTKDLTVWTPTFAWNGLVLNTLLNKTNSPILTEKTYSKTSDQSIELTSIAPSFLHAFIFCHPKLKLTDYLFIKSNADTFESLSGLKIKDFIFKLVEAQGIHPREEHWKLISILGSLPKEFLTWVNDKDVTFSEISILEELAEKNSDAYSWHNILNWIADQKCSKSQGLQSLELYGEVYLRSFELNKNELHDLQSVLTATFNKDIILKKLKDMRFPNTSSKEKLKIETLKKIQLPNTIATQFLRNGDRTTLQVQLNIHKREDLEAHIKTLETKLNDFKEILN